LDCHVTEGLIHCFGNWSFLFDACHQVMICPFTEIIKLVDGISGPHYLIGLMLKVILKNPIYSVFKTIAGPIQTSYGIGGLTGHLMDLRHDCTGRLCLSVFTHLKL
jgi:hypothetical protein